MKVNMNRHAIRHTLAMSLVGSSSVCFNSIILEVQEQIRFFNEFLRELDKHY